MAMFAGMFAASAVSLAAYAVTTECRRHDCRYVNFCDKCDAEEREGRRARELQELQARLSAQRVQEKAERVREEQDHQRLLQEKIKRAHELREEKRRAELERLQEEHTRKLKETEALIKIKAAQEQAAREEQAREHQRQLQKKIRRAQKMREEERRAEEARFQAENAKKLEELEAQQRKQKDLLEQQEREHHRQMEKRMKMAKQQKEIEQAKHAQKLHDMEEQKKAEEEKRKAHFEQLRDEMAKKQAEEERKAQEHLEEIALRRQQEREGCEREVAAAKEQLAVAMQQARDASNPETFEQTQKQILQDFLSKIPKLSFISPLPAELQGKKTVLFLGDVSTGKTSLIRHLLIDHYEGDGRVGVGHATTELRAVAMKDSTVVFDSPGQNNNAWFIYGPESLQSLHQMDVLAVTYITSLSTVRNLLEIAKVVSATRGSRVITVRTKIDLWKERGEPPLEEEMERDKALLNELGMTDIAMFATSAEPDKLPALIREKCQNAALTELLLSPLMNPVAPTRPPPPPPTSVTSLAVPVAPPGEAQPEARSPSEVALEVVAEATNSHEVHTKKQSSASPVPDGPHHSPSTDVESQWELVHKPTPVQAAPRESSDRAPTVARNLGRVGASGYSEGLSAELQQKLQRQQQASSGPESTSAGGSSASPLSTFVAPEDALLQPCSVAAPASSERAPEVAEPEGAVAQAAGETAVAPPPRQALQTKAPVVPSAANEELRRKLEQRQHAMSHPSAAAAPAEAAALQPRSTDPVGMDEDLKQMMMKRRTWED